MYIITTFGGYIVKHIYTVSNSVTCLLKHYGSSGDLEGSKVTEATLSKQTGLANTRFNTQQRVWD